MKLSVVSTLKGGFFFPDLLPGEDFHARMVSLKRLGFDAVEIWGMHLKDHLPEVRRALKQEGVAVSTICSGFRGNLLAGDVEERMTCYHDFQDLLDLAGELGATGLVFVPIFAKRPQVADLRPYRDPYQVERELFLDMMGKLAERARRAGTRLLLEPVNRYETHFVNRIEQAVEICKQVGPDAFGVIADFFHMNIEEVDIAQALRDHAAYIHHVHMGDSNRCLPGQGHVDYRPGLQALKDAGYRGALSLECFAQGEPKEALPQSVRYMKQLLEELS